MSGDLFVLVFVLLNIKEFIVLLACISRMLHTVKSQLSVTQTARICNLLSDSLQSLNPKEV